MIPKTNIMFSTELAQFFSVFDINNDDEFYWRTFFLASFYLGTRRSETVKMSLSSIDFHRKVYIPRDCKHDSDRAIPIVYELQYQLGQFINRFKSEIKEANGFIFFNKGRRIFHRGRCKDGELYIAYNVSPGNAYNKMQHYNKKAGLDKHFCLHSFRGALATYLLDRGVPLPTVRLILGQKSLLAIEPYYNLSIGQKANAMGYAFGQPVLCEVAPILSLCPDTPLRVKIGQI